MSDDDRYHYDDQGNYKGKTSSDPPSLSPEEALGLMIGAGFVGMVVMIGMAAVWLWEKVEVFHTLEAPYNAAGFFYFLTIVLPAKVGIGIVTWTRHSLTAYPNLNLVIAAVVAIAYAATVGGLLYWLLRPSARRRLATIVTFLLPATAAGLWFVLSATVRWLFATA